MGKNQIHHRRHLRESWGEIVDLYVEGNMSLRQVAEKIGCSHEHVRNVINDCGLPINPRSINLTKRGISRND